MKKAFIVHAWIVFGRNVFPELGYREFKQKLNNGTLWEGSRAVSVGKHEVLLKEDTAVIRQRMDSLFKSLVTMLKTALLKTKGRFDEEGVARGVCRAWHGCSLCQTFHWFVAGEPY